MKLDAILHRLRLSRARIVSLQDIKKVLEISSDNTAYKTAERLVKKRILERLRQGLYRFVFADTDDLEIANSLYPPSYISLESALHFYGILPQVPYAITSVTPRKARKLTVVKKEFEYTHLSPRLFFGFEKNKNFLIAKPEKALMDELYLAAKGWRKI